MACLGRGSDGPTGNQWASPGEEQVQTQTGPGEKTTSTMTLTSTGERHPDRRVSTYP